MAASSSVKLRAGAVAAPSPLMAALASVCSIHISRSVAISETLPSWAAMRTCVRMGRLLRVATALPTV